MNKSHSFAFYIKVCVCVMETRLPGDAKNADMHAAAWFSSH